MILMDKGYFDYDYEKVEKQVKWEDTIMSDEEAADLVAMFGIGKKKEPKTAEEYQEYILKEERKNGSSHTSSH